jgi:(p)ppGpp synthase/HD superfamily hydrolase
MNTLVDKALEYASVRHRGQLDDQGRPYFFAHLIQVYNILNVVTSDEATLCAGVLHDIVEDAGGTYEELEREFNGEIADLVRECTHVGSKESGRHFPCLHSKKAIIVKFADRLSNISRMDDWPGDWQLDYLSESRFWNVSSKDIAD